MSNDSGMDRRTFLESLGLAAGAAALGFPLSADAQVQPALAYNLTNPNILLIIVDQLRYRELSASAGGDPFPGLSAVLPNITTLQSESVEFTNYYTAGTSCTPARASMVTGLYPTQTAMYMTPGDAAAPNLIPPFTVNSQTGKVNGYLGFPTFGSYLLGLTPNYTCEWFGKWHLADDSPDMVATTLPMLAYGFAYGTFPSPNGVCANEGVDGGRGQDQHASLPPPGTPSALYCNDQDIVTQFANHFHAACIAGNPWLEVVSLINPHDISSYPNYLLGYCSASGGSNPMFAPVQPGTNGTPGLGQLFNTTAAGPAATPPCGGQYTGWYIPATVANANPWPPNVPGDDLTNKPYLQSINQNNMIAVNGEVSNTQDPNNPPIGAWLGDWGAFLNTYYWLASCADKLIGNLSTPDAPNTTTPTILGQLALQANLGNVNLNNTVTIFTADHGEYGGAHGLQGKTGSGYEEAIHVPLFVRIPTSPTNHLRTQMVSTVDLFGLIAGMATNNVSTGGVKQWKIDNPQLAAREDLLNFIINGASGSGVVNVERVLSSTDPNFNGQPYVLHTTNEFFPDKKNSNYNFYGENYHVATLRTGNTAGGGTPLKLVYYYYWPGSQQYQFDASSAPVSDPPGQIVSEYYDLQTDPGEQTNKYASISSGADVTFRGVIDSELQAALPTLPTNQGGVNLQTVLASAGQAWLTYLSQPSAITVTPATLGHNLTQPQSISVDATVRSTILIAPTIQVRGGGISNQHAYVLDNAGPPPYSAQFLFPVAGTYTVTLVNPNGLYSSFNVTVT